jgi:hypothetical protein
MTRLKYNRIWLIAAVLFLLQSLTPFTALAEVNVRCAGSPSSAPACAHMLVAATDTTSVKHCLSTMACCARMSPKMQMGMSQCAKMNLSADAASVSNPAKCLLSVKILASKTVATTSAEQRWVVITALALKPPINYPVVIASRSIRHLTCTPLCHPTLFVSSHGLRAPPLA